MFAQIKQWIFGKAKDPLDPRVFHQMSLIAFFAWVGLGADGLSSSCYGPEEAFLALGQYTHLAILLALAVAATVFILSASYSQIIDLFPSGGGGYLVATHLIGPVPGLISGCALLVDYVLTIAISVASSQDAIFSFLPESFHRYKFAAVMFFVVILIVMNLRGIKESVIILTPIFLTFLVTHVVLVLFGVLSRGPELPGMIADTFTETSRGAAEIGGFAMLFIFLKAFSLGGGTFTGIEAVSNGLQILREPRVQTGKKTMFYMASSLAFTAGGILISYILNGVHHVPGQTLNSVLVHKISDGWPGGHLFLLVTLFSEGMLLLVAAQAGFLDGPRVMANMAADSWMPRRFLNLSDRLVIKDGVLFMGLSALAVLIYTGASVRLLVVMYSINVFLTFSLSQFGMVTHWLKTHEKGRVSKLAVNVLGLAVTVMILIVTAVIKFREGGWVTLVITGLLVALCLRVRKHYAQTAAALQRLDEILTEIPVPNRPTSLAPDPKKATAILMVNGYNGIGIHSLLSIHRLFPGHFKNFVFLSVGVIDSGRFKGKEELDALKTSIRNDLDKYVRFANGSGLYAEGHMHLDTDPIDGLEILCNQVAAAWPSKVFFSGQLSFEKEVFWTRFLHNQTAFAIQRRLIFGGMGVVILPIRVRPSEAGTF